MAVFARAHDRQRSRFGPSGIQLSASAGYLPEALTRAVSWTRTRNRSAPGCINRPVAPSRGDCLGSDAAVTAARQRPRECPAPGSRADAGDCNGPPTKDAPEVILGRRNDPIQAFAPNRANQPFRKTHWPAANALASSEWDRSPFRSFQPRRFPHGLPVNQQPQVVCPDLSRTVDQYSEVELFGCEMHWECEPVLRPVVRADSGFGTWEFVIRWRDFITRPAGQRLSTISRV